MPIKGKVPISAPNYCIYNMFPGEKAYMHADRIIVTKKAIFIHSLSEIIMIEQMDDEDPSEYILIERTGKGFTSEDFILDMSTLVSYYFIVESLSFYTDCMREKNEYIAFDEFILEDVQPKSQKLSELEELEQKLEKAKLKEDWPAAIKYRDMIADLKKKKK